MATEIELVVITPADLSALIDGELGPEERHDVAACARDDERAGLWLNAWHWQLALLHETFGRAIEEPVPARLRVGRGSKRSGDKTRVARV
jgi:anti-sigma factor RsiW